MTDFRNGLESDQAWVCEGRAGMSLSTRQSFRFLLWLKRQKNISRQTAVSPVAGVDEQHSANHYSAGTIQCSAGGVDSVHGLIFANGVEVPKDLAFL